MNSLILLILSFSPMICAFGILIIDIIHTLMLRDIYSKVCDIVVDADELSQDLTGYYNNLDYLGSQIREDVLALMTSYDCFTQDVIKILASGSVPDPASASAPAPAPDLTAAPAPAPDDCPYYDIDPDWRPSGIPGSDKGVGHV